LADIAQNFGWQISANWLTNNGPFVSNIISILLNVMLNFIGTNFLVFKVPEPDKIFE
jgi:putative flippase GtrA